MNENSRPRGRIISAIVAGMALGCALNVAADTLLIENVTLIDGTGRPPVAGASVLINDDRIQEISRGAIETSASTNRIDGSGNYLIPGLMDLHIHLQGAIEVTPEGLKVNIDQSKGIRALHSYIYSGVTSVYDAGNVPDYILKLRDDERSGNLVSPRIFATGSIVTYPGSHGSNEFGTQVDSWPEAIPALDAHIAREPDILKLTFEERGWGARPMIPILPVDLMQRIIGYYNDRGIRTTVHTSSEYRARQAIFAGVDTLAHPVIQGPVTDDFTRLMAAKKIPMVSTLAIGENYSRLAEHPEYLDEPLYQATLTAEEIEILKTERRKEYQERKWTWWMKIMTTIAQENVRKINDAGGVMVAGTDQSTGPALHRELELMANAGISPSDVIRIATLNGAIFLGKERELGSIEEGKIADMVLLEADPTADINNAKKIIQVIKGGQIIDRSKLDLPVNE
jgi:imidazolonepropionase-like amidohydrolase